MGERDDIGVIDSLARDLASGEITRRTALGRLAGFGVVALVPGFLLPDAAFGRCPKSRRCGKKCCPKGAKCRKGKCRCKTGSKRCGKRCVNLKTDRANCGACGKACPTGQSCVDGRCRGGDAQQPVAICGNNTAEAAEQCDGTDLRGATCASLGLGAGTLACGPGCTYNTSGCAQQPVCGDNVAAAAEQCDGTDLKGKTCVSLGMGFTGGTLSCAGNCTFNTSACTSVTCGNNTIEPGEVCDGTNLGGQTCVSRGFAGGTLACAPNCQSFDTSGCVTSTCGNNLAEPGEACDGTDLGGQTCQSLGFASGTLACAGNCQSFDTSNCVA